MDTKTKSVIGIGIGVAVLILVLLVIAVTYLSNGLRTQSSPAGEDQTPTVSVSETMPTQIAPTGDYSITASVTPDPALYPVRTETSQPPGVKPPGMTIEPGETVPDDIWISVRDESTEYADVGTFTYRNPETDLVFYISEFSLPSYDEIAELNAGTLSAPPVYPYRKADFEYLTLESGAEIALSKSGGVELVQNDDGSWNLIAVPIRKKSDILKGYETVYSVYQVYDFGLSSHLTLFDPQELPGDLYYQTITYEIQTGDIPLDWDDYKNDLLEAIASLTQE